MPVVASPLIQFLSDNFIRSGSSSEDEWQLEIDNTILHNQDNVSTWNSDWSVLGSDLVRVLLHSGLKLPASVVSGVVDESAVKTYLTKNKQLGASKASTLDVYFRILVHALSSLLLRGCESGPVTISLEQVLPVLSTVLSLTIRADPDNSKDKVLNENGLSTLDLAALVPKLKIQSLRLLSALLATRNPGLLRLSSALSDPLLSMLLDTECIQAGSALAVPVLSALTGVLQACPATALRGSAHKSLQSILEQFRAVVNTLTQSRTSVVHGASSELAGVGDPSVEDLSTPDVTSGEDNVVAADSANSSLSLYSMDFVVYFTCLSRTVESLLLLHCGPMLPAKMREHIEITLAQALLCLTKGVLPLQPPNRHLKRCLSPEVLRQSPALQKLILQLCVADALTPSTDGIVSGNLSLLRSVCQSCLLQSDTTLEAVRALCVIDAVLFPSAITLPANHHVLLNRKLAQLHDSGTSAYGAVIDGANKDAGGVASTVIGVEAASSSIKVASSSSSSSKKSKKMPNAIDATKTISTDPLSTVATDPGIAMKGASFKRAAEAVSDVAKPGSGSQKGVELTTLSGQGSASQSASQTNKKAKVAVEEDGDVELPDIHF